MKKVIGICLFFLILGIVISLELPMKKEGLATVEYEAYGAPQKVKRIFTTHTQPEWDLTNVSKLILVKNKEDIEKKRKELIDFFWKNGFPKRRPNQIVKDINKELVKSAPQIESIDYYQITEKYGLTKRVHHVKTNIKQKKNELIIFIAPDYPTLEQLSNLIIDSGVKLGYDFIFYAPPIARYYKNKHSQVPIIETKKFGNLTLGDQNLFFLLEDDEFFPLQLYLNPIAISLNFIEDQYDYQAYHLIGITEGGWEATIYPALDPRIKKSYAFYPPYPIFIKTNSGSKALGNYEQLHPGIFEFINYPTIYVMASSGEQRSHMQIIDNFDFDAFSEASYAPYKDEVKKRVNMIGQGEFKIELVHTDREDNMEEVIKDLIETFFSDLEGKKIEVGKDI